MNGPGRLIVELPRAIRYIPNSGPLLEPVRLVPPRDSTAYIIERILLLPTQNAGDGRPLPKRMAYIIGWHDMRGARLLIPAANITDYVSPRELEDWEDNLESEIDKEKIKLQEEKVKLQTQPGKRKRGRPPLHHTNIETAAVAELDTEEDAKGRFKGALIISTPKKSRLKDFEGLSDESEEPSPSQQLTQELYENIGEMADFDMDDVVEMVGYVDDDVEMVGYADDYDDEDEDLNAVAAEMAREITMTSTERSRGENQTSFESNRSYTSAKQSPMRVATPQDPSPFRHTSQWVTAGSTSKSRQVGELTFESPINSFTPVGIAAASAAHQHCSQASKSSFMNVTTFTSRIPSDLTPFPELIKQTPVTIPKLNPNPKKEKAPEPLHLPIEEDGDQVWIVKAIEDDDWYEVEGRGLVRYFQVRWQGTWPKGQNPTWEPEENIEGSVVKRYLKKERKQAKEKVQRKQRQQKKGLNWGVERTYGSASEAFEGDGESEEGRETPRWEGEVFVVDGESG